MAFPGPGDNPAVPEHPCHKGFTVKFERLNRKRNLLDLGMELTDFWHGIVLWTVCFILPQGSQWIRVDLPQSLKVTWNASVV